MNGQPLLYPPLFTNTCSSFFTGSPKKQMAGSREPGGKQDQDTGDIFFHSTSLTKIRYCGFRVGHLSSILLFASSTCLLPPIEGIIRIKDFCTPATIESFNIWLSVQTVYWFRCLLSAARTLRGDLRLLVANTSDVQGEILLYDGCKSSTAPAQNGLYVVAACCKITNTVGNTPIWGEKYKRGSFRKYKWCTRRNPSLHWLPEKWRNWGKGVRGPQWADETCQIGSKWQNLMFIHDWFQFRWAFWCRIFFDWEPDLQSWNIAFLGVRSPNPLPKASGLGNLTTSELLWESINSVLFSAGNSG